MSHSLQSGLQCKCLQHSSIVAVDRMSKNAYFHLSGLCSIVFMVGQRYFMQAAIVKADCLFNISQKLFCTAYPVPEDGICTNQECPDRLHGVVVQKDG